MPPPMKRILIIDDEPKIRRLYSSLLSGEGFSVFEARNADEATGVLMAMQVDLVLLDIKMPETDGCEMQETIKEYDERLKVIVASVYTLDEQRQKIPGADDYFDKAQGTEVLLTKVKKVLGFIENSNAAARDAF